MKKILFLIFIIIYCKSIAQESKLSYLSEVLFSGYVNAKSGLNYRTKPNINSQVIGKFDYGTKLDVLDNSNYDHFWVNDNERGSLFGKWVGVKKGKSTGYVFNRYLFLTNEDIDAHITYNENKFEVIYKEMIKLNKTQSLIIEKHMQISSHLVDYTLILLEEKSETIFKHKIDYLFKDVYWIENVEGKKDTFKYLTSFDECPSSEYYQVFTVKENEIIKIDDKLIQAEEK